MTSLHQIVTIILLTTIIIMTSMAFERVQLYMTIELRHLKKKYDNGEEVLTDINATIENGQFYILVGASGSLVGYAGGVARKQWLLDFEQDNS